MKLESGLEIKLLVAGVALHEYEGEAEENGAEAAVNLTRYVEAVSGSTFAIRITMPPGLAPGPDDCLCCRIYLDGKYATTRCCDASCYATKPYIFNIQGVDRQTPRGRELQRFLFSQLRTNDDSPSAIKSKPEDFKKLGLVNTRLFWCRKGGPARPAVQDSFKPAIDTSVPEKCLKGRAISNHADVAAAEPLAGEHKHYPTLWPYGTVPFASFTFKYRSRKDLQIEGIIEKDPEPVPLQDRDPDTLTQDEVRQLQLQLQAKQEEMIRVKKEKRAWVEDYDDEVEDEILSVTNGPSTKKRKTTDSGLVIDLTVD